MSETDPPPLEDDVRTFLRRGPTFDAAPADARERVLARVEAVVAGAAPLSAAPHAARATRLARRLFPLVVSFAVGGGAGAFVASKTMRPQVLPGPLRVVYLDRPVPAPAPPPIPAPARAVESPAIDPSSGAPPQRAPADPVRAERRLLDAARGALERDQPTAALQATAKHQRSFPRGVLAQEREAIAIRALVMLGRRGEAQQRASRFRTVFPDSALWPAIESSIGSNSQR